MEQKHEAEQSLEPQQAPSDDDSAPPSSCQGKPPVRTPAGSRRPVLTRDDTVAVLAALVQSRYWNRLKPSVKKNYAHILNNTILPAIEGMAIQDLEEVDWLEELLLEWQEDDIQRTTINGRLSVIASLVTAAMGRKLISTNPLPCASKVLEKGGARRKVGFFTDEDELTLLQWLPKLPLVYYCLFLLLLRTGMRIGEALGLKIADIDLEKETIAILRSWTCGVADSPKYDSERVIAISADLLPVLRAYLEFIRAQELTRWLPRTEWLFPGQSRDKPLNLMPLRKNVWKPLLEDAGLTYRRIHDLRHTFASSLLTRGLLIALVSAWLGHKDPTITARIYWNVAPTACHQLKQHIGPPTGATLTLWCCSLCQRPF